MKFGKIEGFSPMSQSIHNQSCSLDAPDPRACLLVTTVLSELSSLFKMEGEANLVLSTIQNTFTSNSSFDLIIFMLGA